MRRRLLLAALATLPAPAPARAQPTVPPLRIGVLGDLTGIGAASSGAPAAVAARMAVNDFGPLPGGRPVEVISAEFRLRPDEALDIARHWFDDLGVSVIADLPTTAAAIAVQNLARTRNRTVLNTASISPDLSGQACAPIATQWAPDSIALGTAIARGVDTGDAKTWYLIVPDTPVSLAIQRDAARAIEAAGGRVIGISQHPSGLPDFTAPVTEAAQSGARAIGLCGIGDDLAGTLRQARAANLMADGRQIAAFFAPLAELRAAGIATAQDILLADGFYWNESNPTRSFAARFNTAAGRMPGMPHAALYAAVLHYLRGVVAANTSDAIAVNREMRRTPVYFFGRTGRIRADGRVVIDLTLYRVQASDPPRNDWDCWQPVQRIPGAVAFRPIAPDECTLSP